MDQNSTRTAQSTDHHTLVNLKRKAASSELEPKEDTKKPFNGKGMQSDPTVVINSKAEPSSASNAPTTSQKDRHRRQKPDPPRRRLRFSQAPSEGPSIANSESGKGAGRKKPDGFLSQGRRPRRLLLPSKNQARALPAHLPGPAVPGCLPVPQLRQAQLLGDQETKRRKKLRCRS